VLEDRGLRATFLLSDNGYHRAHKIRLLHGRVHENQARERKTTMRPEVGLAVSTDIGELLVEVKLAQYYVSVRQTRPEAEPVAMGEVPTAVFRLRRAGAPQTRSATGKHIGAPASPGRRPSDDAGAQGRIAERAPRAP
jgi:hypothetical protein